MIMMNNYCLVNKEIYIDILYLYITSKQRRKY